jgi:glutamate synthase domain-containing protein 2
MIKVRIINKAKDGVTIKYQTGHIEKYSWEEFNSAYDIKDNVWGVMKPELEKIQEEIEDKLSMATVMFFEARAAEKKGDHAKQLSSLAALGGLSEKIKELGHFNDSQVMQLIQNRVKLLDKPATWQLPKETPQGYRARKAKEANEEKKYRSNCIGSATTTLGDLPGFDKLKEKFGK